MHKFTMWTVYLLSFINEFLIKRFGPHSVCSNMDTKYVKIQSNSYGQELGKNGEKTSRIGHQS